MDRESVVGTIIYALICWGCSALFFVIGLFADRKKAPVNFWSGREVKAEWVKDIPAYNHENAVMWKLYSVPYFLCGVLGLLGMVHLGFTVASIAVMVLAVLPGFFVLIRNYRKIEKKYILSERLDKVDPFC